MVRSMTGYGAAEGPVGAVRVSVEVRSVNHRFFNPTIKLPAGFARWEGEVREALRQRISRGHVTLVARVARDDRPAGVVDEQRFADYVRVLRELRDRFGLAGDVDLATVLRMPEVFGSGDGEDTAPGSAPELVAVVNEAAAALAAMRHEEGERLAAFLEERLAVIDGAVERIAARAPQRLVEQRERLREAVRQLADGLAVEEARLAQEIAILADRLDVTEELARFRSHVAAFRGALRDGGPEPVGKRLGFVLQEMLREANTTGSKANDSAMLAEVVVIKEELERIREQVENLE
jgi:uncharacterized protein (TIGR00255 family)